MAFDYGSIDLGLKNPFKIEGKITAVRGVIQTTIGLFLLISAAAIVKEDVGQGWTLMIFGAVILGIGLKSLAGGIYAVLRYFVGRSQPTSLAANYSKSESSSAHEEFPYVGYQAQHLEEMLMGRKNPTFIEPQGLLARLLHSFFPSLLYMPYPIRNMAQNLFVAWVNTLVSLTLYGLVAFVSLAGFAGDAGELSFPIYSVFLLFYLMLVWSKAGKPVVREAQKKVETLGANVLTKIISLAIMLPVIVGVVTSWVMEKNNLTKVQVESWLATLPSLHVGYYLVAILLAAIVCSIPVILLLQKRMGFNKPIVEVSELRENWQESVHPNEIFINLDNLVMANRRYKEVPNRVYRELDPQLNEQIEGKGDFKGELIQETQPKVKAMDLGSSFNKTRLISLVLGNALSVIASIYLFLLAYASVDLYKALQVTPYNGTKLDFITAYADPMSIVLHTLLIGILFKSFANILLNTAHVFFAEIQFESLLVYFKCEGTFTESKISTGTGIHDSTRSENTLVRSSITPWVIVSKIVSTTFAATGMRNLEHPRHILEMHKDDEQLEAIKQDIISFLKDRESIASITSARDLGNASQIHQLNQQTRAIPVDKQGVRQDTEAAGFIQKNDETPEST